MNAKQTIHFPADYALMTKEELAGVYRKAFGLE